MDRLYRALLPTMAAWLVYWLVLSWASIQDDALIHLRYADNLLRTHMISYDGVHPSYGASSLLYVNLLAFLRHFISSPNLPRGLSSTIHLLFFAGLTFTITELIPRKSSQTRLLGLILLFIFVTPSAVRWLDDGMETGLVLCFVTAICVAVYNQAQRETATPKQYIGLAALAFLTVLLRTELILLCGIAFLIAVWPRVFPRNTQISFGQRASAVLGGSHLLLGSAVALAVIFLTMGVLLPDTAIAKSEGIAEWRGVFGATITVLTGAMTFGLGLLFFWLLTLILLVRKGAFTASNLLANAVFPILLILASLRGQQIQGARYLVWSLFFSVLWNVLQHGVPSRVQPPMATAGNGLVYAFIALVLVALPVEAKTMHHVLTARAHTMKVFESQHLEYLEGRRGLAMDVGYIGYFSKANICDLAGLVNGREQARRRGDSRTEFCIATHPQFLFVNEFQIEDLKRFMNLTDWQVCGQYDFVNVHTPDTHYLLVPRSTSAEICKSTTGSTPLPDTTLIAAFSTRP